MYASENFAKLTSADKGAIGELKACVWLLSQGYEVYRNISAVGIFDIVAIKDGLVKKIDVKLYGGCNRRKQEECKTFGGNVLYLMPDGAFKWDYEQDSAYNKLSHICLVCAKAFKAYEKKRKFCSSNCKMIYAKSYRADYQKSCVNNKTFLKERKHAVRLYTSTAS